VELALFLLPRRPPRLKKADLPEAGVALRAAAIICNTVRGQFTAIPKVNIEFGDAWLAARFLRGGAVWQACGDCQ
jgi:hypothetical protein